VRARWLAASPSPRPHGDGRADGTDAPRQRLSAPGGGLSDAGVLHWLGGHSLDAALPAPSPMPPPGVTADVVQRVLAAREAFAAHKGSGGAARAAAACGAPDGEALVEACAERLLGDALHSFAADLVAAAAEPAPARFTAAADAVDDGSPPPSPAEGDSDGSSWDDAA
jgi:hypothetical protein